MRSGELLLLEGLALPARSADLTARKSDETRKVREHFVSEGTELNFGFRPINGISSPPP